MQSGRRPSNQTEMARRRKALAEHRADVLYDEPHSRVGTLFLEALTQQCGVGHAGEASAAGCAPQRRTRNESALDAACLRKVGLVK